jgi:hypothetical protein
MAPAAVEDGIGSGELRRDGLSEVARRQKRQQQRLVVLRIAK